MVRKLIVLISALSLVACFNKSETEELLDFALDNQFYFRSRVCLFRTSELSLDSTKSILNNSCTSWSEHHYRKIILESIQKKLILKKGGTFMDSISIANIRMYLSDDYSTFESLSYSYKYSNRNMFSGYKIITDEVSFEDETKANLCLIEISEVYYSSDKRRAVLGLINHCVHHEVYFIYYFKKVQSKWMGYLLEENI